MRSLTNIVLILSLSHLILSQPDLCRNPKIDSIAYMPDWSMYFFTSGGYYWKVKTDDFPPQQKDGKPLPKGFKRGDAAVYVNTLDVCKTETAIKPQEKEVYLMEKTDKGNQLMIFDTRAGPDSAWKDPVDRAANTFIGRALISDWNITISAMFEYKPTEIYVVAGAQYAGIDWIKICTNPKDYADTFPAQNVADLGEVKETIDAMTYVAPYLYAFIGAKFFRYEVLPDSSINGKIAGIKKTAQDISTEFFKYKECPPPSSTGATSGPDSPSGAPDSGKVTGDDAGEGAKGGPVDPGHTDAVKQERGGSTLIIIIIIVVCVVALLIGAVLFFLCKKKPSTEPKKADPNQVVKIESEAPPTPGPAAAAAKPKSPAKK